MTHLIKRAFDDHPWDFIIPLDSDEFLRIPDRAGLEAVLADFDLDSIGLVEVLNHVPTKSDDLNETDVLRRIVHRAKTIPDISPKMGKVVIPGAVIKQPGFSLNEGHHGVCINGKPVPERWVDGLSLAHFPIRSINQFILRTILCRLAWSSRSDYNPSWGWHYGTFFKQLKVKPTISAADLTEAALLYVDIYIEPGQTPHQKVLVREPVTPAYDRLRFTNRDDMAVLPPILDMMEFVVDELRAARMASPGYGVPVASEAQRSVNVVGNPAEERAVTNASPSARHTFQSFWHGGALSPYELFCLKSFIDCGYAVDLYTYDLKLLRRRECGFATPPNLSVGMKSSFIRRKVLERGRHRRSRTISGTSFSLKGAVGGSIPTSCASLTAFPSSTNFSLGRTRTSSLAGPCISRPATRSCCDVWSRRSSSAARSNGAIPGLTC